MEAITNDNLYDEPALLFHLDNLRQQDVTPSLIANIVFKICDPKFSKSDECISRVASFAVEKIFESPLNKILQSLDTQDFQKRALKQQTDYGLFLQFCRILCGSDKQGRLVDNVDVLVF